MGSSVDVGASKLNQYTRHLSLGVKTEQDFLEATCEWLGEEFQAEDVSLFTASASCSEQGKRLEKNNLNEVVSWVKQDGNTLLTSHSSDGNAEVLYEKAPANNDAEHTLKVPALSCWPHETTYILRGCTTPAVSSPMQPQTDPQKSEVTPISTILHRTAIELARKSKGVQDKDQVAVFNNILASISDAVFSIDHSLKYTFINDAFCKLLGKSQQTILGCSFSDHLQKQQIDNCIHLCGQVINGQAVNEEISIEIDGSSRTFQLHNIQGNLFGICTITHNTVSLDIIEQNKSAASLLELQKRFLKINRYSMIGEIASSLAHNITQHITAICNYSSAVRHVITSSKSEVNNPNTLEYMENIEHSAHSASNILNNIHTFTSKQDTKQTKKSLSSIIDRSLEVFRKKNRYSDVISDCSNNNAYELAVTDREQVIHVLVSILNDSLLDDFPEEKLTGR